MNLATKEYVDDNGGETKAKAWLCTRNGLEEMLTDYCYLEQYVGSDLESLNYMYSSTTLPTSVWCHQIAKLVFKEEKSMVEVTQWLNFEAKIHLGGSEPVCSDLSLMASYGFCAVCPWPDNVPWPESN